MSDDERYIRHLEMVREHLMEQVSNVQHIAMRGFVFSSKFLAPKGTTGMLETIEWTCPSCWSKQAASGACQNPKCVPGEVMRALFKETRVQRFERQRSPTPESGCELVDCRDLSPHTHERRCMHPRPGDGSCDNCRASQAEPRETTPTERSE